MPTVPRPSPNEGSDGTDHNGTEAECADFSPTRRMRSRRPGRAVGRSRDAAAWWKELAPAVDFAIARVMTQMRPGYVHGYRACGVKTVTQLVQRRFKITPLWYCQEGQTDCAYLPPPPAELVRRRINALCRFPLKYPASTSAGLAKQLCGAWSDKRHAEGSFDFRRQAVAAICMLHGVGMPPVLQQWVVPAVLRKEGAFLVKVVTGKVFVPRTDASGTLDELTSEIEEREGMPTEFQKLIYQGRSLAAEGSLASANVLEGSLVYVMIARHHYDPTFLCVDEPMLVAGESNVALEDGADLALATCVSLNR